MHGCGNRASLSGRQPLDYNGLERLSSPGDLRTQVSAWLDEHRGRLADAASMAISGARITASSAVVALNLRSEPAMHPLVESSRRRRAGT
jgi:hypothetical protein